MKVAVYACPTRDCGNYFGASRMPDLHAQYAGPRVEDVSLHLRRTGSRYKHTRAECPDCRTRGVRVERELIEIDIPFPTSRTPTPELPRG